MPLFDVGNESDLKLDGIVLKHMRDNSMLSYFEILNNGFAEAGLSRSLIFTKQNSYTEKPVVAIHLTRIIGYEMLLLGFAKKLYDLVNYYDDILLQISFVNVLNLKLTGFNDKIRYNPRYEFSDISNKQHTNFKLNFRFNPKTLTDDDILEIAKKHSEQICRVFGLDKDHCFIDNSLSVSELNGFYF
jgi:hypothetical protein